MFFWKKNKGVGFSSIKNIFDQQSARLLKMGYPDLLKMNASEFGAKAKSCWDLASAKFKSTELFFKGSVPVLLVVNSVNILDKIKKINGHTELDLKNLKEDKANLNDFYLLLDVENGAKTVAKSPKDCLKSFKKEGRMPLNLNESIALLTHYPEILQNHYLISAGTFYLKDGQQQPILWLLDEDKNPELHYAWFNIAHGSYGTASYAKRI